MTNTQRFPALPLAGFGLLVLVVYGVEGWMAGSGALLENPDLTAAAITVDLTIVVPLLFYLFFVRGGTLPAFTVLPVFVLSVAGAGWLLPAEHHTYLRWIRWAAVPAELAIAGVIGIGAYRKARRVVRGARRRDLLEHLRESLGEAIPVRAAAEAAAYELALLYYALFSWRGSPDVVEGEAAYTYHRRSGYVGLLGAAAGVALVEAAVMHLLIERWSPSAAWIVTGLGLYGVVWMVGLARSVVLRPILITPDALHLRIGLQWTARIPFERIAGVRPAPRGPAGFSARLERDLRGGAARG